MELYIDYSICIGCEACAVVFPDLFEMRDDKPWVLEHGPLDRGEIKRAVRICPVNAISAS